MELVNWPTTVNYVLAAHARAMEDLPACTGGRFGFEEVSATVADPSESKTFHRPELLSRAMQLQWVLYIRLTLTMNIQ